MIRTQIVVSFCFGGLPELDWWHVWRELASLVEAGVQPDLKTEMITWVVTPATSLSLDHLVVGGTVELCHQARLPQIATVTVSHPILYGLRVISRHPVSFSFEMNAAGDVRVVRPSAKTLEAAADLIATTLR